MVFQGLGGGALFLLIKAQLLLGERRGGTESDSKEYFREFGEPQAPNIDIIWRLFSTIFLLGEA